ncbi:dihydrofolate reductase family protein [Chitinophagaceae bacterium LB-8]|uniref:Dihydrofolate reductase family protein n=1 Tax=Paraflavisolibacter caeni TaxID=2982496 RepID=A0A9X3BIM6_9BACT|nr:dihydrofolate reductase family protein [Paraflavisolibacter caeni]MCU7551647.1 dihydrofolate reductase family protein [Paraflavisolibacter caeni]
MRKLSSFTFITLDGYYKGQDQDISWHKHGAEEGEFSAKSLKSGNILLFGRTTYEMMASYWPTQMAMDSFPLVAEGMNKAEKIVFSRTLQKANWEHTRIISENIIDAVQKLKQQGANDMTLLGSGSILRQLAEAGLIDEYQVMIDPVAIGSGTPIFQNLNHQIDLKLINTRTFKSGVILLSYQPA